MIFDLLNSQEILDLVENIWRGGLAKKKASFVSVELLPRGFLVTFSKFWMFWPSARVALQKTRLSSTKNRCVNLGPFLQMETPQI